MLSHSVGGGGGSQELHAPEFRRLFVTCDVFTRYFFVAKVSENLQKSVCVWARFVPLGPPLEARPDNIKEEGMGTRSGYEASKGISGL